MLKMIERTEEQAQWAALRKRVAAVLDNRVTTSSVAVEIGVTKKRLVEFLEDDAGTSAHAFSQIVAALKPWLDQCEAKQKQAISAPAWVDTGIGAECLSQLENMLFEPSFALFQIPSGMGKTAIVNQMKRKCAGEGDFGDALWIVRCTQGVRTANALLGAFGYELGIGGEGKNHNDVLERRIGAILAAKPKGSLLILEEAQVLFTEVPIGLRAIDALRTFYDDYGLSIALFANSEVYKSMRGDKTRLKLEEQLTSRLWPIVTCGLPLDSDVDAFMEAWGIGGAAERAMCIDIARKPGHFRNLNANLKAARRYAIAEGRPFDIDAMRMAARDREFRIGESRPALM